MLDRLCAMYHHSCRRFGDNLWKEAAAAKTRCISLLPTSKVCMTLCWLGKASGHTRWALKMGQGSSITKRKWSLGDSRICDAMEQSRIWYCKSFFSSSYLLIFLFVSFSLTNSRWNGFESSRMCPVMTLNWHHRMVSPVWYNIRRTGVAEYTLTGEHDVDKSWMKEVRGIDSNGKPIGRILPRFAVEGWDKQAYQELMTNLQAQDRLYDLLVEQVEYLPYSPVSAILSMVLVLCWDVGNMILMGWFWKWAFLNTLRV